MADKVEPALAGNNPNLDTLEFYRDQEDLIRWRYRSFGNNEILADSGQGYHNLNQARESAFRVFAMNTAGQFAIPVVASGVVTRAVKSAAAVNVEYVGDLEGGPA